MDKSNFGKRVDIGYKIFSQTFIEIQLKVIVLTYFYYIFFYGNILYEQLIDLLCNVILFAIFV